MRQQVRPQRGKNAQAHGAGLGVAAAARGLLELLDFGHDAARTRRGLAPGRGQHDLARRAFDQRHAQLLLQQLDLPTQRRLGDVQHFRGAGEIALVGHSHEIFELTDVHKGKPYKCRQITLQVVDFY